jgi:HPt (histidine-containing phosphotransfer) domain-containing protein
VIGLTAHALEAERDKCLAVGMLDHISKPIDPARLISTILHWTHRSFASVAPTEPAKPAAEIAVKSPIDWTLLNQRFNHRHDFIDKLLRTLLQTQRGLPQQLRDKAEAEVYSELAFLAHSLKGSAGNLAALELQELAARAEQAARAQNPDGLLLAKKLAERFEQLFLVVEQHLREGEGQGATPYNSSSSASAYSATRT